MPPESAHGFLMLKREQMLCFSLGAAMRRISQRYAKALAEHDITPPQLFLLSCLRREDGQKPHDLAEQACLDNSSITGLLDRTEKAGLVVRRPDSEDGQALRVHLTDRGRERLAALETVVQHVQQQIDEEFFANYTPEQVALFKQMLQQVREVVQ